MALLNVIKFEGNGNVLVWKYPNSELQLGCQLIVNESQEAIFFRSGRALDLFKAGRYTIKSSNIPLLAELVNLPFNKSPFAAEVWFINKQHVLDVLWGTKSPIQIEDPKYRILIPVRANGQFGLQIQDSRKFLIKMVGTLHEFSREDLVRHFRGVILTKVKSLISKYLAHEQISVVTVNVYLDELSKKAQEEITNTFDEYGICFKNFYINSISIPEEDPSVIQLKAALAKRAEMEALGYTYQQERGYGVMEKAAGNEGNSVGSSMMGAGMGMGMGMGVGNLFGGMMANMGQGMQQPQSPTEHCPNRGRDQFERQSSDANSEAITIICDKCGSMIPKGAKFCPNCGDPYHACPFCGADNALESSVCSQCGKPLPVQCQNCNSTIPAGVKFCPECGMKFANGPPPCPYCGAENIGNGKFCPECGKLRGGEQ